MPRGSVRPFGDTDARRGCGSATSTRSKRRGEPQATVPVPGYVNGPLVNPVGVQTSSLSETYSSSSSSSSSNSSRPRSRGSSL
jgi:hypothetical protein